MFKRIAFFAYGLANYIVFLGVFLYSIGFVGNLWVPTSLDAEPTAPLLTALLINLGLLAAFAVQHSGMARRGFKRAWTKVVPSVIERSTYVLFSNVAMIVLFVFWEPMGGSIWNVTDPVGVAVLYSVYALGWVIVFVSTLLINHFDLFGLSQVYRYLLKQPHQSPRFTTPGMYKWVRHPLYFGWLVVFWATPTMTAAHLLFAVGTTAYIVIAIQMEERDLIADFGDRYRAYQRRVPMLIPRLFGRKITGTSTEVQ